MKLITGFCGKWEFLSLWRSDKKLCGFYFGIATAYTIKGKPEEENAGIIACTQHPWCTEHP